MSSSKSKSTLTFCILGKNSDILKYFCYFSMKTGLGISCKFEFAWNAKPYFLGKNKKNIKLPAELAHCSGKGHCKWIYLNGDSTLSCKNFAKGDHSSRKRICFHGVWMDLPSRCNHSSQDICKHIAQVKRYFVLRHRTIMKQFSSVPTKNGAFEKKKWCKK